MLRWLLAEDGYEYEYEDENSLVEYGYSWHNYVVSSGDEDEEYYSSIAIPPPDSPFLRQLEMAAELESSVGSEEWVTKSESPSESEDGDAEGI